MQLRLYVARCRPTVKDGTVNAAKPRDSVKKSRGFNRGSVKQKRKEKNMGMMSLKRTTYVTTRYDVYGGFYVEVTKNPEKDYVDFVLCRENYGFKSHMIGIPTKDCPESVWEDLIRRNVDSYIAEFIQDIEYLESQPMSTTRIE